MIKLFFKSVRRNFSSKKALETLNSFPEYNNATSLMNIHNWAMAELELKRCIEIIKNTELASSFIHNFVLESLAKTQFNMKKHQSCEATLRDILKNLNYPRFNKTHLSIARLLLMNNPERTEKFCFDIEESGALGEISESDSCQLVFIHGTALALSGKFEEAIEKLERLRNKFRPHANVVNVLEDDIENSKFFGQVLNNLGVVKWMKLREDCSANKFCKTRKWEANLSIEMELPSKQICDFSESLEFLQQSVKFTEVSQDEIVPSSDLKLNDKVSGRVLANISEVYLELSNQNKAIEWIKATLKFSEEKDSELTPRALLMLGHVLSLSKNALHAEGIFRNVSEQVKNVIKTQNNDYLQVFLLEKYASLLRGFKKRVKEASEMEEQAREIRSKIPAWKENEIYLILPGWSI